MRKLYLILFVAILFAGCAKVSDITTINGTFSSDAPEGVLLSIPEMEIEQMVEVKDGKFSVEVPTDITTVGNIVSGMSSVEFVPDGTVLTINFDDTTPTVTSDKPKISTQVRYDSFMQGIDAILSKEDVMSEEQLEQEFLSYCVDAIKDNPDNAIGLTSISNIYYMLPLDQLEKALGYLSPVLKEKEQVKDILTSLDAKKSTAEGGMFADFTIVQDPDNPAESTVKFSDYIGKGKYILVDFWASWCGPCIREIPNLKNVYATYGGDKFDILSVAVWDKLEDTKRAAEELELPWNQIVNAQQIPTDLYGIDGIPHIILFGPDGTILKRELRGPAIAAEIAKYVSAN